MQREKAKNKLYRIFTFLIIAFLILSTSCGKNFDIENEIHITASLIYEKEFAPKTSSVGGEWAVIGIMNSNIKPDLKETYAKRYYDNIRTVLKSEKGLLTDEHYTEYARAVMGIVSIGKDPTEIEGYDLTAFLDDYDKITAQGVNAASYALIASNMAGIKLENADRYIDFIIEETEKYSESDYMSMAILGLSYYQQENKVKEFIAEKTEELSQMQQKDGSLGNCESTAEAIIALTAIGVDVMNDERFVKKDGNLLDGLMLFKKDSGYIHINDDKNKVDIDMMATEKALLAIESLKLFKAGSRLYESAR